LTNACARADSYSGTWTISPSSTPGKVQLEMRYSHVDSRGSDEWEESHDIDAPQVRDNAFTIHSDAGDFQAQGRFNGSQGGGTWTFSPNPNFGSELARRGVGAPSAEDQFALAMSDFKLASLDALLAAGFARPGAHDLVRMSEHGVSDTYIAAMKGLQFSPKTVESLIRLRDHGVTPEYMRDLQNLGYRPSAEELVRLRDHGVSANFVQRMREHGYTHLSADELIELRDHGF
jgi:hypothetical protein